ncbi:MAG: S-layer homology domain-containing protein [Clostridia bacterium]|nr:S-layer homology domain-containing protein [Clostridia bacterium]
MKRILTVLLVISMLFAALPAAGARLNRYGVVQTFDDIDPTQGAASPYLAVEYLYEKGIVSGKTETRFYPDDTIKREELAKILTNVYKEYDYEMSDSKGSFSDVESGAWYEEFVEDANALGVMKGIGENKFGVGMEVTRQDAALIIYRMYEDFKIPTVELGNAKLEVSDIDSAAEYAREAIKTLVNLKTADLTSGKFDPTTAITRGDVCKMLYRMLIADRNLYNDRIQSRIPQEYTPEETPSLVLAREGFENGSLDTALPSAPGVQYKADWTKITTEKGYESNACLDAKMTTFAFFVPIKPSCTYRVDWKIKTEGLGGGKMSTMYLYYYNSKGERVGGHHDISTGAQIDYDTDGWISQSFAEPAPNPDTDPKYLCVIPSSSGAGTGNIYYDDFVVTQIEQDLMYTVLASPSYKGLIYEENGENDINVHAYLPGRAELIDFEKMELRTKILDKDDNVIMQSTQKGISEEMSVSFSSKYLEIGDYYLNIAVVDPETDEVITFDEWDIRKREPDYRPRNYFDEYGRLVNNGKPEFVTGVYNDHVDPTNIAPYEDTGITYTHSTSMTTWWTERDRFLKEEYEGKGMQASYNISSVFKNPQKGDRVQRHGITSLSSERAIIEHIMKLGNVEDYDGLMTFALEDELAHTGWAHKCAWHKDILDNITLDIPTYGVGASGKDVSRAWYKAEDIRAVDAYVFYGLDDDPIHLIYDYVKELSDYTPNRPVWNIPQSADLAVYSPEYAARFINPPNEQDYRYQAWATVAAGGQGIVWYSQYNMEDPTNKRPFSDTWAELVKVTQEIETFEDIILSTEDAPVVSVSGDNEKIGFTVRRYKGKTYVIVVNGQKQPQNITVSLEGAKSVYGVYSDKNYKVKSDGSFDAKLGYAGTEVFIIEQEDYLSPSTKIKDFGFYNGKESYVVLNNTDAKDGVLNIPEGVTTVDYGINTVNDKIKVYINGEKAEKFGTIDLTGLSEIKFKIEAEDARYYDEYTFTLARN